MREDNERMKLEVKAQKRQNKLLAASHAKQEQNRETLEEASTMIDFERSKVIKDSAIMPGLNLSPFLPLSQQVNSGSQMSDQNFNNSLVDSKLLNQDLGLVRPSTHADSM